MANFSFLQDMDEYSSFAEACIEAENVFKDSSRSCISNSRSALESAVKWVYNNDENLSYCKQENKSSDLFYRMNSASFQQIVPKKLLSRIHKIRTLANEILHEGSIASDGEALGCLEALFDFVQWIDKRYGERYEPRIFSVEKIPKNSSALSKGFKYVGAALTGAAVTYLFTKKR